MNNSFAKVLILIVLFPLWLLGGCSTLPTGTAIGPKTTLPNGLTVHDFKLPNGMRLLLVPNDEAPVFYIQTLVETGSLQEALDPKLKRTGLAHLFEHMMFRGTEKYPSNMYDKILSSAGEEGLNATTSYDRTNYYLNLPKEKLELILELESDRFQNLKIDEALFKKEIGAVLGELKLGKDNPDSVAYETLMGLIFQKHPYGLPIIGLKKDVETFSVEEALYFYRKYYSPNNYTMLIVGDIDVPKTVRLVRNFYDSMKPQKIVTEPSPIEPTQIKARSVTKTHHAAKNRSIRMGFPIPKYNHVDNTPLLVLSGMLGDGNGALLQKNLVDAGLASSVSVYSNPLNDAGVFGINAQIRPGVSKATLLKEIRNGIDTLADGKFTDEDLERAKNTLLLYSYFEINSNSGIANALVEGVLHAGGDYRRYFDNLEKIKTVTRQDIIRVAKYYLAPKKTSVVYMIPENKNAR